MSSSIYEQMGLVTTVNGPVEPGHNWREFARLEADTPEGLGALGYLAANMVAAASDGLPDAPVFMNTVTRFGERMWPVLDNVMLQFFEKGAREAARDIETSWQHRRASLLANG